MYKAYLSDGQVTLNLDNLTADAHAIAEGVPLGILECRQPMTLVLGSQLIALEDGDIVLLRSSEPAILRALPPRMLEARLFIMPINLEVSILPNDVLRQLLSSEHPEQAHIVFRRMNHAIVRGYCNQLAQLAQLTPQDMYLRHEQSALASLLLTELSPAGLYGMMIIESAFPDTDLRQMPRARKMSTILNYITANLDTVTLHDAAEHFGYEVNYFSRLCNNLFDKPFSEEVRFLRMNQAKKLLRLTNQSIASVAFDVGYKNPANFSGLFKEFTGMTPRRFRQLSRKA